MMRLLLIIAWLILGTSPAFTKEYGNYDGRRVLTVIESPSGKRGGIDLPYLDSILNDLAAHARNYPPTFDSDADRGRATRDAGMLADMLDVLVKDPTVAPEILFRAAFVNGIAHNLNIRGAAEKASSIYQRLLVIAPDHARTNYNYGAFLAGTGKFRDGIPFLEKAWAAGVVEASYSLGMVYLSLGDKVKALEHLENYRARAPAGAEVSKLIDAIQSSKVETRESK